MILQQNLKASLLGIMLCISGLDAGAQQMLVRAESFTVLPGVHIRALEAVNDSTAWFAANRGVWGYTTDSGKHWIVDSLRFDSISPQFRSMAVLNDSTVLLLSIASPAYLVKTTNRGRTWRVVYKSNHKEIFFDSMVFRDEKSGLAIGDPIDGCFQIIETNDGGDTWKERKCGDLPVAAPGEACFATSNTNLDVVGNHTWFVTGGKKTRIFRSTDGGKVYKPYQVPLPEGETMSGAFTMDFYDRRSGVVAGGHYERSDSSLVNFARTVDGGRSWQAMKFGKGFFGSCARFRNKGEVFLTGHNGTYLVKLGKGTASELVDVKFGPLNYFTLRIAPGGRTMWLAGNKGRIARVDIRNLR